ncbi:hypothetical protein ABEB36_005010 [Hypothenemus hampei]|uniref:mRNA cap guanine-N(7) methyltransferase n=1 Tax=Hypothenemus hampei TaxID=57062 RepID=A0ABD1EX79_HYPHA
MSEKSNTDDLEQTVMLAAAAADSRHYEESSSSSPEQKESEEAPLEICPTDDTKYYQEIGRNTDSSDRINCPKTQSRKRGYETENSHEKNTDCSDRNNHLKPQSRKRGYEAENNHEDGSKGKKRKAYGTEASSNNCTESSEGSSHSEVVATHYNLIEDKGLQERFRSPIIYLRIFHNWIKSMLIDEYLQKTKDLKKQYNPVIRVHDMACGKGGDLSKWKKHNISHLICSDIAEVSLEHCKQRYDDMKRKSRNDRGWNTTNFFSLELIHGDAGQVRYREKFSDPSIKIDLVSCQFAFHYSFESLPQAENWFRNVSECLQAGGYFIGTMIDSNEIISRARKSQTGSFGNDVFEVNNLEFDLDNPPLFGGKYNFHLYGVVDCPEFLVHFPTFVKLARKYGLKFIRKEKFNEFFHRMKDEGKQLLTTMGALETYPPVGRKNLVGDAPNDYDHAKEFMKEKDNMYVPCGTLSRSEWEASTLYMTFAFEKLKNTWNPDGTPCYEDK